MLSMQRGLRANVALSGAAQMMHQRKQTQPAHPLKQKLALEVLKNLPSKSNGPEFW
jgi:hypothetical protein